MDDSSVPSLRNLYNKKYCLMSIYLRCSYLSLPSLTISFLWLIHLHGYENVNELVYFHVHVVSIKVI